MPRHVSHILGSQAACAGLVSLLQRSRTPLLRLEARLKTIDKVGIIYPARARRDVYGTYISIYQEILCEWPDGH